MDDWQTVPSNNNIIIIVVVVLGIIGLIILLIVAWNSGKSNTPPTSSQHDKVNDMDDTEDDDDDSFGLGTSSSSTKEHYKTLEHETIKVDHQSSIPRAVQVPKVEANVIIPPAETFLEVPKVDISDLVTPPEAPNPNVPNVVIPPSQPSPKSLETHATDFNKVEAGIIVSESREIPKVESADLVKSISASDNFESVDSKPSEPKSNEPKHSSRETSRFSSDESLQSISESSRTRSEKDISIENRAHQEALASVEGVEITSSDEIKDIIGSMNAPKNQIKIEVSRPTMITQPVVVVPYVPAFSSSKSTSSARTSYVDETSGCSIDATMSNPASFSSDFSAPTELSTTRTQRRKLSQNPLRELANMRKGRGRGY